MKQDYHNKQFYIYRKAQSLLEDKQYLQIDFSSIGKDQKPLVDIGDKSVGLRAGLSLWEVEEAQGKKYRVRNTYPGVKETCYLTVDRTKGNRIGLCCAPCNDGEGKEDQFWTVGIGKDYSYEINSHDKLCLDAIDGTCSLQPHPENQDDFKDTQQWRIKLFEKESDQRVQQLQKNKGQAMMDAPKKITKFCGEVYLKNNCQYQEKIYQYATSSYPKEQMTPFLLAAPKTIDDISFAVEYAKAHGKKIVARSGGHQYSGKSSGGDDTIVISMENFNKVECFGDNIVKVEPCCKLKNVAKEFAQKGITVPHGECPEVNIGGHAQTGGYGHLLRGFGLFLDYVVGFDIVLADGSFKHVTKPKSIPTTEKQKLNQQLFRGVLSGNAGSFGIVTKYVLNAIRDKDHPKSHCLINHRLYDGPTFKKLLKVVQQWTIKMDEGNDEDIRGLDFMMSIKTLDFLNFVEDPLDRVNKAPLLVVECVYADPDGGIPYNNQFERIKKISNENQGWIGKLASFLRDTDEERPLSQCSLSFVRKFPAVTRDGREFKYPYKKRINATNKPLTDAFIDEFCKKADQLCYQQPKVNLIFQMCIGGGQTQNKGKEAINGLSVTGIPNRNVLFTFVFDLFYEEGGEQRAEEIQNEMQELIDKHYNHGQEKRLFWGSFGNTNMSERKVVNMYYDSEEQYKTLQELKGKVDPDDLFHTSFTVQLPGTTKD